MIIILGLVFLILVFYEIFILKKFDFKKVDTDKLLTKYNSNLESIIEDVANNIDYKHIYSEEDLYCYLMSEIYNQLEFLLLQEKLTNEEYEALTKEVIEEFINSKLINLNIDSLYQKRYYQVTHKEDQENNELATERVSNSIKSDSSTVDITNDLLNTFFNE